MSKLYVLYNGLQHCTAMREPQGNKVAMDCPHTGRGEQFSPGNLVGAGLAGCMLISMGTLALRDEIDINDTRVDIELIQSRNRIESIRLVFNMPGVYKENERLKLERAANLCPMKSSFHPETVITVIYKYHE